MASNGALKFGASDDDLENFNNNGLDELGDFDELGNDPLPDEQDALNDETFGAAVTDDWESAHERFVVEEGDNEEGGFFDDIPDRAQQHQLENELSQPNATSRQKQVEVRPAAEQPINLGVNLLFNAIGQFVRPSSDRPLDRQMMSSHADAQQLQQLHQGRQDQQQQQQYLPPQIAGNHSSNLLEQLASMNLAASSATAHNLQQPQLHHQPPQLNQPILFGIPHLMHPYAGHPQFIPQPMASPFLEQQLLQQMQQQQQQQQQQPGQQISQNFMRSSQVNVDEQQKQAHQAHLTDMITRAGQTPKPEEQLKSAAKPMIRAEDLEAEQLGQPQQKPQIPNPIRLEDLEASILNDAKPEAKTVDMLLAGQQTSNRAFHHQSGNSTPKSSILPGTSPSPAPAPPVSYAQKLKMNTNIPSTPSLPPTAHILNNIEKQFSPSHQIGTTGRPFEQTIQTDKQDQTPVNQMQNRAARGNNGSNSYQQRGNFNQRPNQDYHQRKMQGMMINHRNQLPMMQQQAQQQNRFVPNPLNPLEMINIEGSNFNQRFNQNHRMPYSQRNYNQNYAQQNNHHYNQRRGEQLPLWAQDEPNPNQDEYAGLMTQRDVEWVQKILKMPLEFNDPYVQDYYYVTYQTRKIAAELLRKERETGKNQVIPTLIVPERGQAKLANVEKELKYTPIQFEGSLGKLQVSNVKCPRKMLDFSSKLMQEDEQSGSIDCNNRSEVNKFRKTLLEIERNYAYILKIEDEDRRMGALPADNREPHRIARRELCDQLSNGILTTDNNQHLNLSIANIRKGCMLIFRALQVLHDQAIKAMFISELLRFNNFRYVIMQKDKTLYCLDYGQILIDTIKSIRDCDFALLLKIADGLDNACDIAKYQCGQEIIEVLLNQFEHFKHITPEQKIRWLHFLERVLDDVDDIPHLRRLCSDHIHALAQAN